MYTCIRCLSADPAFFGSAGACPRCGAALSRWPGRFVPQAEPLAEGGYARIFLACDAEGRQAVLKLPRGEDQRVGASRALATEAEVLAALPAIEGLPALLERVEIVGPDGPVIGLVMSRIDGTPLSTLLDAGVRSDQLVLVVRAMARLLRALCTEGSAPLHHLDLKPGNVLVRGAPDAPRVGLIDFGSARATDGQRGITPAWAAPELRLARGADLENPEAADVWSLGLLLYTGITGRHPLNPDEPAPTAPLPLPDLDRLPAALAPVVASCLDHSPERRPRLAALVQALDAVALPPPTRLDRAIAPPARWRVSTVDVQGFAVLIIDDLFTDEPAGDVPFDAASLVGALAPWLGDPCAADPDTRWTPERGPGSDRPSVAWGRDLVCALGLGADAGALSLLRHGPTGAVLPPDPDDPVAITWAERCGAADPEDGIDRLLASPDADWAELARVPVGEGRLVVFPGLLFHRWVRTGAPEELLRFSLGLIG